MVPLRRAPRLLAAVFACLAACQTPILVEVTPEAQGQRIEKLALLPFAAAGTELTSGSGDAALLVTGRVLEQLVLLDRFDLVPPLESARLLRLRGRGEAPAAEVCRVLHAAFGVDAVLFGTLHRFAEREGRPRGASRPAAVRFELEMRGATGRPLWRGSYNEVQQGLIDDPRSLSRASERGFRFVTAEELARYGARELVQALGRTPWR